MSIFRAIGFLNDDIDKYIQYVNSDAFEDYPTGYVSVVDKCYRYLLFDDVLELWTQHLPKDEEASKYCYFSFKTGLMHKIHDLEEHETTSISHRIFKFRLNGVSYPIFAEFPISCVPEIDGKSENITLALTASEVCVYKNPDEFHLDFGDINVESINSYLAYIPNGDPPAMACAYINGTVKSFEKLTNSFTHNDYFKIVISSYEFDYVVYAEEDDVDPNIAINDIISVQGRMFGGFEFDISNPCYLTWSKDCDADTFDQGIASVLLKMRELILEFLVVSFDSDAIVDNINFIQTKICDGNYVIEIKKTINGKKVMYRRSNTQLHDTLKEFYDLCINRKAPDISKWEDITEEIFGKNKSDE